MTAVRRVCRQTVRLFQHLPSFVLGQPKAGTWGRWHESVEVISCYLHSQRSALGRLLLFGTKKMLLS